MTTIVLADDHLVVRQGLRALLDGLPDHQVVGEAADGLEALDATQRLKPDVLIVDMIMPGLHGLEVIQRVRAMAPATIVIALSMHSNELYALEALRRGANAYVLKGASGAYLVEALRVTARGRRYLSPPLSESVIEAYARRASAASGKPDDFATPPDDNEPQN